MKNTFVAVRVVCGLLVALACAGVHAQENTPAKEAAKLEILKAFYGDLPDGAKTDVTDKVKAAVNANGLSIDATNDNFGDPAEGTVKKLKVEYTLNGQKMEQTVNENENLTISLKPSKLVILKAFYGDLPDGAKTDVTAKVQSKVRDDALSIDASNENFGDPVEGTLKKLRVEYTFDGGAKKTKEATEGETLTISNKGE